EECRRQWGDPDLEGLLVAAAALEGVSIADAFDDRLLAPVDMAGTIAELADLADATDRAAVTRCAVESMAASAAQVLASLPSTDAVPTRSLRVFGGGIRSELLLDALARRTTRR